jgi:hypothetical protein
MARTATTADSAERGDGLANPTVLTSASTPALNSVDGNSTPHPNGTLMLRVTNGGVSPITLTLNRQTKIADDADTLQAARTHTIAAGDVFVTERLSPQVYSNSAGEVEWRRAAERHLPALPGARHVAHQPGAAAVAQGAQGEAGDQGVRDPGVALEDGREVAGGEGLGRASRHGAKVRGGLP